MTKPEAEAVRAFNAAFWTAGLSVRLHNRVMHLGANERMKRREPPAEWARIETPQWALEHADAIAREIVAGIAASGIRVVGDLGRLVAAPGSTAPAKAPVPAAVPVDDWVPSEIAAEMALGVLFAGGLAAEGARTAGASPGEPAAKAGGRRAAARDPETMRGAHDLTGVRSRDLVRALAARARAAGARRVRRLRRGAR